MAERSQTIILYGSYGYTGSLIASECKSQKQHVILAGRNEKALAKQSEELGFPFEAVAVDDRVGLIKLFKKGALVIHCAGPFQFTAHAVAEACIAAGTHYTDITGEYQVFELLAEFDSKAKDAGIMIMPGTGFDVVPSDCLAAHLKRRLPDAEYLQLAFSMSKGGVSRGTSKTMVEGLGNGSVIRKNGKLIEVPLGKKKIEVDFGNYQTWCMNIPWGDISTAWRSTGIPNIEVYMGAKKNLIRAARLSNVISWFLRTRFVKRFLLQRIEKSPAGPAADKRETGKSHLWGRACHTRGVEVVSTLVTLSGYKLTATCSVMIAIKVLKGNFKPGYQTPAMAYGPDLILEVPQTLRVDR